MSIFYFRFIFHGKKRNLIEVMLKWKKIFILLQPFKNTYSGFSEFLIIHIG